MLFYHTHYRTSVYVSVKTSVYIVTIYARAHDIYAHDIHTRVRVHNLGQFGNSTF